MQNVIGPTLVAMATKFGLGAAIQSPTGLLLLLDCKTWRRYLNPRPNTNGRQKWSDRVGFVSLAGAAVRFQNAPKHA